MSATERERILAALDHSDAPPTHDDTPEDIQLSPGFAERATQRIRAWQRLQTRDRASTRTKVAAPAAERRGRFGSAPSVGEDPIATTRHPNRWRPRWPLKWLSDLRPYWTGLAMAAFAIAVWLVVGMARETEDAEATPTWSPPPEIASALVASWDASGSEYEANLANMLANRAKDRLTYHTIASRQIQYVLRALGQLPSDDPLHTELSARWRSVRTIVRNQRFADIPATRTYTIGRLRRAMITVLTSSSTAARRAALRVAWDSVLAGIQHLYATTFPPCPNEMRSSAVWVLTDRIPKFLDQRFRD